MAAISPAQLPLANPADAPKTLTEEEVKFNELVSFLENKIENIGSDIFSDMKVRQLPDGLHGDKVYGPKSANRAHLNTLHSQYKKAAAIVGKNRIGLSKKVKKDFEGFAAPCYIVPEAARIIGLAQGTSVFWAAGEDAIFSAAFMSGYFSERVRALNLVHKDNLSKFTADETMRRLFLPIMGGIVDGKGQPLDLNNLTYPGLQKLITKLVIKKDKSKGPILNPETERGKELTRVFKQLKERFKELKALKDEDTLAIKHLVSAEKDLVAANTLKEQGEITAELFQQYADDYRRALDTKTRSSQAHKAKADEMGITRV